MKRSSSQQNIKSPKSNKFNPIQAFQLHVRSKYQPFLKISSQQSQKKIQKFSKKTYQHLYFPSLYTSPNSYQNSEIVSKKQSREKSKPISKKKSNIKHLDRSERLNVPAETSSSKHPKDKLRYPHKRTKDKKLNPNASVPHLHDDWHHPILSSFLRSPLKYQKRTLKLNKIEELAQRLRSTEQQSSTSSKNFLKHAMNEENGYEGSILHGKSRIVIIDWMLIIGASLIVNRETIHLAVHYMDSYLKAKGEISQELHILAGSSLLLSVKQQERQKQTDLLQTICLSQKFNILKNQILMQEQEILLKLNFRLKSNTIAFWVDYFGTKWDRFITSSSGNLSSEITTMLMRSPDGDSYRYYRQLMQISDIMLFFGEYTNFSKSNIALSILYLVIRIELETKNMENQKENFNRSHENKSTKVSLEMNKYNLEISQNETLFSIFKKLFMKKATPIFKDPLNFNETFNCFLTQLCEFQLNEIIPCIKFVSNFLDLKFSYHIDDQAFEQARSYEQFIRKMTYSSAMKQYSEQQLIR